MKLTVILLLGSLVGMSANTYSQNTKLNVSSKNATLINIFRNIEDQSEFYFYFNKEEVKSKENVSIEMKDVPISDILDKVLSNTGLEYKIIDRYVVIKEKGAADPTVAMQVIRKMSGKTTDQSGASIPGVSVIVKGTVTGTISDADGNYVLGNVPENATLVFSFVGMKTKEIAIAGKTVVDVVLEEESIGLGEVVAIGYGTTKKSDLTGSVASVQGATLAKRETTQLSSALQGAVSGVMVTKNNGAPGATATIRIRGITTIGTSDPLIIVDGVPAGNIDDVNPNDVESMSVLKDAAAASIYGSRAAAGVILITTKRGKTGATNITYRYEYGIEKPTTMPTYTSAVPYLQYANEQKWNDNGNVGTQYPVYTQDYVNNYATNHLTNPDVYPDTDWDALTWKKNSTRQTHSISISSGMKNLQTNASFSVDNIGGLYDKKDYKRINARVNNDITINKFLSANIDLSLKRVQTNAPTYEPQTQNLQKPAPIYAAMWTNGLVAAGKAGSNVYGQMEFGGTDQGWSNQLAGKISLDFKPFDGFKVSAIFSPTYNEYKQKVFQTAIPYTNYNDPNTFVGYIGSYTTTSLNETRNDGFFHTFQFLGTYDKSFGKHNLNLMAGYEDYYSFNEYLGASRDAYELTTFPYLDAGPLTLRGNNGSATEYAYRSFFGRVMYNFENRYLLQANIRQDGSSRFDPNYRWSVFPSFSAGWVVSKENFMSDLTQISFLKLRASWGSLGNERIGNYPYQAAINFGSTALYQGGAAVAATTAAQSTYAIPDISWETTETTDFGLDLNLFKNKLRLTGDYYLKTTRDMLLALQIPPSLGFDNPNQNTGIMNTKGWELEASWNDKIGEVGYSFSANLSDFKSKMGNLGGTEFIGDQIKVEGSEFNEWYGYRSLGLFQTATDVAASPKLYAASKPGDIKYQDISGPNGVQDGIISAQYDRVRLGGSLPRFMYGGTLEADYKGFDFNLVFQGVGKQNSRITSGMVRPLYVAWTAVPTIIEGKFWSNYNTPEQNLQAAYPRLSENAGGANNYMMSDYWLFNGAYFRLKNLTLGYTLPVAITNKVKMQNVRLYTTVSDLLCINNFPQGWDPEVGGTGYPITMTWIFGVSVKF